MDLKTVIGEYNTKIYPEVEEHNKRLRKLAFLTLSDEERAKKLLIDVNGWCKGGHQWYLKFHKDIYNETIADIISHQVWDMPLDEFASFEALYDSFYQWLRRPYINQLTIYDVVLRLVIAREEKRLMPCEFVYIHAKPRKVYGYLYKTKQVLQKPQGWNIKVPVEEFRKNFGTLKHFDSYLIEDLLCYIAKNSF